MASTKAMHSAFPVASNSRNDRTRDRDQSMAATTDGGERSIRGSGLKPSEFLKLSQINKID